MSVPGAASPKIDRTRMDPGETVLKPELQCPEIKFSWQTGCSIVSTLSAAAAAEAVRLEAENMDCPAPPRNLWVPNLIGSDIPLHGCRH